jgi:hypothetical protein
MTASSLPSRENGLLAEGLDAYPNLKAIIEGRIAGNFREWPAVRGELERLLMDQAELMRKASDALQSYRLASSETASVTDVEDAKRWREHCEVLRMATTPDALHMRLTMNEGGQVSSIEYVLDTAKFGRTTVLGIKAIGLAAEEKATKLFAAMDVHRHTIPQGGEHG